MISDMVIYATLINLTEMECIVLLLPLKSYLFFLFMCFRIFNFGQIKIMIFCGDENFKNIALLQM